MVEKRGRKTVMTKLVLQKLREAFLLGYTDSEACLYAGISDSTLYNYQKSHPEYLEEKRRYKLSPQIKAKNTLYASLGDVKVAMWFLERKCPEEFGRWPVSKPQSDHANMELTEEELLRVEQILNGK